MLDQLNEIEKTALTSLESIHDPAALEAWRVANVGRSSPLMQVFAELGKLSREERPTVGAAANRVKTALEAALTERAEAIKNAALAKSLEEEQLDAAVHREELVVPARARVLQARLGQLGPHHEGEGAADQEEDERRHHVAERDRDVVDRREKAEEAPGLAPRLGEVPRGAAGDVPSLFLLPRARLGARRALRHSQRRLRR